MSTFFDETHIRQILQAVNIVDIVGNYVALQRRGKEMVGLCPFHNDSKPSMNVNVAKQIFKCFACGAGGDVIKFIMLREQMTFPEAVRFLAERAGVKLPERQASSGKSSSYDRNELEAVNRWAARVFRGNFEESENGRRARDYVSKRGISEAIARRFGIGWAPDSWDSLLKAASANSESLEKLVSLGLIIEKEGGSHYDRFRERLIFPVLDALGRVIGFGGRTLGTDPAKYINSTESAVFNKSRALYGLHAAKDSIVKSRTAVVVEGYTDCIVAHQFGITNAVATLGTALTEEHSQMLCRYADTIILVFDSDQAGRKAADRAIEIFFTQQINVKIVTLPAGKDPCDFLLERGEDGGRAFEELLQSAADAVEYKWQTMEEQMAETDTPAGHQRAVDDYLDLIAKSVDEAGRLTSQKNMDRIVSQGYLFNRVAKLVGCTGEQVLQRVNQRRRRKKFSADGRSQQNGVIRSGKGRAQQEVLEVLLNQPDMFEQVGKIISGPEEFAEPVLQQIAQRLWKYFEHGGSGELVEILAGCESTQLCNVMTEMAHRGAQRANYTATLEGALENLSRIKDDHSCENLREVISTAKGKYGRDAEAALMLEIQSKHQPDPGRHGSLFRK